MSSIEKASFGRDLTHDYNFLSKDVFPSMDSMFNQDFEEFERKNQEIVELFRDKGYSEEQFNNLCLMVWHDTHDAELLEPQSILVADHFIGG